jgi:GTP pyrophosphokinase
VARGREAVEKLLQREGRTAMKLEDLAAQLGFKSADDLFEVVGKDEFSLRNIENLLHPPEPVPPGRLLLAEKARAPGPKSPKGGVLVVGVGFADDAAGQMLQAGAARCDQRLRHARQGRQHPPQRLQQLPRDGARSPERVIEVEWGAQAPTARSTRWTWPSRPPTGRACCATSPKCSPRRR